MKFSSNPYLKLCNLLKVRIGSFAEVKINHLRAMGIDTKRLKIRSRDKWGADGACIYSKIIKFEARKSS